jgi:type I restriction-modification system DNA methylase subunit
LLCFTRFFKVAHYREPEYLEEAKHWSKEELNGFAEAIGALVLENPFEDILGGYYMECALSHKGQKWNGEFHTPKAICDLMAQMTLGDLSGLPADGPITVLEPACGAGAMILATAQIAAVCASQPSTLPKRPVTCASSTPRFGASQRE